MQLNTVKSILEKVYSSNNPNEICLIDRGIVDTLFWNTYHQKLNNVLSENLLINTTALKEYNLLPSLLVVLYTTPDEAINRRGGEGRIVTFDFVKRFNKLLLDFIETFYTFVPVYQLDTSGLSPEIVSNKVLKEINKYFLSSK